MPVTEDISQPSEVHGVGTSASTSTASFSPPAKSLLVACVTAITQAGAPSLSVSDSGSHTWTLGPSRANGGVKSAIYYSYLAIAPGSITVTAADSSGNTGLVHLTVRVLDGCTSTQTGQSANASDSTLSVQGAITPAAANSAVYVAALIAQQETRITALADTYPTHSANFSEIPSCHLTGRSLNQVSSAETLGWAVSQPAAWAWSALEIQNADVAKSSSDSGAGSEPTAGSARSRYTGQIPDADSGQGSEQTAGGASGSGVTVFKSSSDAGSGIGGVSFGAITVKFTNLGSTDSGSGSETRSAGPATLAVKSADYATGTDGNLAPPIVNYPALAQLGRAITEGFSLDRVAMLDGTTGAENEQLYGAQQVSLTPDITASELMADDDQIGVWYSLNKAVLQVTAGFLPFTVLAAASGVSVSSFGSSPSDYYGLPLITQYGLNRKPVPVAFRMQSRNDFGDPRSFVVVLYAVQIGQLDFTGTVYKNGLMVSYTGTVAFSSVDETGAALPSAEIGRIVSLAGAPSGAIGSLPFRGI